MTEKQKIELEKIQNEVKNYYFGLEDRSGTKLGCKIFYSNLSNQTDILFIGINPGTGDDNTEKDVELMEEGLQYYFWENNNLAKDTLEAFEKAGYGEKLRQLNTEKRLVKTNLYYLLTKDVNTLKEYIKTFGQEFKEKHIDWTSRIIELCKPKLIIYEGKMLNEDCPPSSKETIKTENKGDCIVFDFEKNINGIMYSRSYPQAGIKNIDEFSEILKVELDKIYE